MAEYFALCVTSHSFLHLSLMLESAPKSSAQERPELCITMRTRRHVLSKRLSAAQSTLTSTSASEVSVAFVVALTLKPFCRNDLALLFCVNDNNGGRSFCKLVKKSHS